ncbi:uncharacterized protein MYCFIDRAFT_178807 [Pseudocercospora fijiensis CIRAD86]|uniref:Uncharacterized protein n=1 Tax=Pseudocercospora fijiensis (strain CIRAD86) TaxID=383855 RepID=M2YLT9_PSEFD|nr:uncharacterized protein MYCFIDRAFT_178807 [Pseudocercospora fijiensis CIRAD86]EME78695.1 hypothetical protein MYCFIDRAFT_178807 [Pseudocercospora fijiensis CIRAD86]
MVIVLYEEYGGSLNTCRMSTSRPQMSFAHATSPSSFPSHRLPLDSHLRSRYGPRHILATSSAGYFIVTMSSSPRGIASGDMSSLGMCSKAVASLQGSIVDIEVVTKTTMIGATTEPKLLQGAGKDRAFGSTALFLSSSLVIPTNMMVFVIVVLSNAEGRKLRKAGAQTSMEDDSTASQHNDIGLPTRLYINERHVYRIRIYRLYHLLLIRRSLDPNLTAATKIHLDIPGCSTDYRGHSTIYSIIPPTRESTNCRRSTRLALAAPKNTTSPAESVMKMFAYINPHCLPLVTSDKGRIHSQPAAYGIKDYTYTLPASANLSLANASIPVVSNESYIGKKKGYTTRLVPELTTVQPRADNRPRPLSYFVQSLPQELFDLIYEATFTVAPGTLMLSEQSRANMPRSLMQIDRYSRAKVAEQYYANTIIATSYTHMEDLLAIMTPQHKRFLRLIYVVIPWPEAPTNRLEAIRLAMMRVIVEHRLTSHWLCRYARTIFARLRSLPRLRIAR